MKKVLAVTLTLALALVLSSSAAVADRGDNPSHHKEGGVGSSNVGFVHYYQLIWEQLPDGTWQWTEVVWNGAWGKLKFNLAGPTFDFLFNGHGLQPNTEYALVRATGAAPPLTILASGTTNGGSQIHLAGSHDFQEDLSNPQIWLVLGEHVNDDGWWADFTPNEYLFDQEPSLDYDDTDVP